MMKRMFILLMTILVVGLLLGCAGVKPPAKPTPVKTTPIETTPVKTTPTPVTTVTTPTTPITTPTPVKTPGVEAAKVECSVCHKKSEAYPAHKEGSGCLNCHGTDPHRIHVGPGTINLKCEVCHGPVENLTVPKGPAGQPSCVNCHDSTNPLAPFKNYVNVHIPRGKPCTVCHTQDIAKIHAKADEYAR